MNRGSEAPYRALCLSIGIRKAFRVPYSGTRSTDNVI